jgi:putative transposase
VGFDGGKRVKGRKRPVLVDTLGLLIAIVVTAVDVTDATSARRVVGRWWAMGQRRLCKRWADAAYAKEGLGEWRWGLKARCKIDLEVTASQKGRGFQVIPHRWVVERTFAWLFNYRRLAKDYETKTEHSEAMIQIAMIHFLVKRLAK